MDKLPYLVRVSTAHKTLEHGTFNLTDEEKAAYGFFKNITSTKGEVPKVGTDFTLALKKHLEKALNILEGYDDMTRKGERALNYLLKFLKKEGRIQ